MHGGDTFASAFGDELLKLADWTANVMDIAKKQLKRDVQYRADLETKARAPAKARSAAAHRAWSRKWPKGPPATKNRSISPTTAGSWNVHSTQKSIESGMKAERSRSRKMRGTDLDKTTTVSGV